MFRLHLNAFEELPVFVFHGCPSQQDRDDGAIDAVQIESQYLLSRTIDDNGHQTTIDTGGISKM